MAARAAAPELATPADDPLEILSLRRPRGEPPGRTGDRCQSEDARSALAGALRGEVGHDAGGCFHPARLRGEEVHDPASQRQAACTHRVRVKRQAPLLVRVGPATEVATEQYRLHLASESTGRGSGGRQCRSKLDFVNPGMVDAARYGEEANAPRSAMTETLVPGLAAASDQRG